MVRDAEGFVLAVLIVGEVWKPDLKEEGAAVWGEGGNAGLSTRSCEGENFGMKVLRCFLLGYLELVNRHWQKLFT